MLGKNKLYRCELALYEFPWLMFMFAPQSRPCINPSPWIYFHQTYSDIPVRTWYLMVRSCSQS